MSNTPLILATGSNLGDRVENLNKAKNVLKGTFNFICESQIYESKAIEFLKQPDFLNQVLEFECPDMLEPLELLKIIKEIESQIGRAKTIDKGPRKIDIDIIFYGDKKHSSEKLNIPHKDWDKRSFVVIPLSELPFAQTLSHIPCPKTLSNTAIVH